MKGRAACICPGGISKEAQERGQREWPRVPTYEVDANYKGKGMQLQFTVEDANVFTMPWSAIITYRRPLHTTWEEFVCAENIQQYYAGHAYYSDKDATVPIADKPDFRTVGVAAGRSRQLEASSCQANGRTS
jgi:hypothetical protein